MLAQELGRDTRLRSALSAIEGRYDYVLLDTGPQFTTVMANVLVYAVEVVVPLDPGVFAMLGVVQLGDTLAEVREAYGNDRLHLAGLVLTKVQRSNVARDVEAELRARFGDLVYGATVPLSSKIEEAHTRGQTVMEFAPSPPGRSPTASSSGRSSNMVERRTGAGSRLSGVLERATPHNPVDRGESDVNTQGVPGESAEPEAAPPKGKGGPEAEGGRGPRRQAGQRPDDLPAGRPVRADPDPGPSAGQDDLGVRHDGPGTAGPGLPPRQVRAGRGRRVRPPPGCSGGGRPPSSARIRARGGP